MCYPLSTPRQRVLIVLLSLLHVHHPSTFADCTIPLLRVHHPSTCVDCTPPLLHDHHPSTCVDCTLHEYHAVASLLLMLFRYPLIVLLVAAPSALADNKKSLKEILHAHPFGLVPVKKPLTSVRNILVHHPSDASFMAEWDRPDRRRRVWRMFGQRDASIRARRGPVKTVWTKSDNGAVTP